jgi:surfactin synthase thioesterase subunit
MPRTAKPYRLIPAEVPPLAGRGAGLYAEIVADFVASDVESALVELPGRKANSLNVGLRKAVTTSGARVRVRMRGGQVYLQKA